MAEKNKLSIYLIKDEFASSDERILKSGATTLAAIDNVGIVYYIPSHTSTPAWVHSFFRGQLSENAIFTSNARVVLICRINVSDGVTKTFALTMGYGKNMLADDVVVEDFGLKVVVNSIASTSIRRITKVNIGGNQKSSNEQLPLVADIDAFGFDIERDLISTVTGRADDEDFMTGIITGNSLLSLAADVDINNISLFLEKVYHRYISSEYRESFGWIDHIRRIKSHALIDKLDASIIEHINNASPKVWMAVPEVIEWENIEGFRYAGKDLLNDIDLSTLVAKGLSTDLLHIDQIKKKRITAVRSDNGAVYTSWSAYKCLYGEIELDGKAYCINNGNWFSVEDHFAESINAEYASMPISEMPFLQHQPEYKRESQYTQAFVNSDTQHLLCMDAKVISHGGGQSSVELCDILTSDSTYIHIKPYSGSAALSHLFNQAVVSAELIMSDAEFRSKANARILKESPDNCFQIKPDCRPTVILAIISKSEDLRPPIPFFSKIALRYTKRRLQAFGCKVYIKNIHCTSE